MNHAAIICEGSTLKSTFANALTLFFCEASGIMAKQGKPCIAYGSEVGAMEPFLEHFASKICKDTYFITRTEESQLALEKLGQTCAVFHSGVCSADIMTGILKRLSLLVTSRYHAAVLSMESGVPIAAVSMDERLDGIMRELSYDDKYLLHVADQDLDERLYDILVETEEKRQEISNHILAQRLEYQKKLAEMGRFLKTYIDRRLA